MSASGGRDFLIQYMFEGFSDPLRRVIVLHNSDTSPEGVITAPKGVFYVMDYPGNAVNGDCYINDDAATSWVLINDETP